jgi:GNAT superfamily N-acetyltransferase
MQLPDGSPVGTQRQLTEGTPEATKLEAPKPEAPKPVTDEGALRDLKAEGGKVTEKTPAERLPRLLQESLKPAEKAPEAAPVEKAPEYKGEERRKSPISEMAYTGSERRNAVRDTAGVNETIARDQNMPKSPAEEAKAKNPAIPDNYNPATDQIGVRAKMEHDAAVEKRAAALPEETPTGYEAKKEEVVPAGAEGRAPAKSAAEYHPAVEQKVSELSDQKLRQLAKAHGLNPDEYDFNARDEGRHRVERDQLAKDVMGQLGDDEKINLGRAAEATERQPGWDNRDKSAKGRADQAEKLFPRLRGPVDEFGNPKVSGGAPEANTKEAADRDNEHFANAKKELGDKASISDVAKRAQEMKDAAKTEIPPAAYTDRGDGLHEVLTGPATDRIGHLLARNVEGKADTVQVATHWVAPEMRGKGVGSAQLEALAQSLPKEKTTLLSDDEMTPSAKAAWEKFMKRNPESVTKTDAGYSVDLKKMRGEEPDFTRFQTKTK